MTEDILISVRGLHTLDIEQEEEETDELEMTMPGKYYFRNGKHYVLFEETDEESQSAGLAEGAAALAEEQVKVCRQGAFLTAEDSKRSCSGNHISILWEYCGGHGAAEGQQQENSCGDRRVCKVLTDAAEQALYNDNSEYCAESGLPERNSRGEIQREKETGNGGRKVADGLLLLADEVEY